MSWRAADNGARSVWVDSNLAPFENEVLGFVHSPAGATPPEIVDLTASDAAGNKVSPSLTLQRLR